MDFLSVITLIEKGVTLASTLIDAGKAAKPALDIVLGVTKAQKEGKVTREMLEEFELQLDALIEDFNKPMD